MIALLIPTEKAFDITPSDADNLPQPTRGLYVGISGDVKITTIVGSTITFVGLAAGLVHPIRAIKVFAGGTTATAIVGVL